MNSKPHKASKLAMLDAQAGQIRCLRSHGASDVMAKLQRSNGTIERKIRQEGF